MNCPHCSKTFITGAQLRLHIEADHNRPATREEVRAAFDRAYRPSPGTVLTASEVFEKGRAGE